MIIKSPTDAHLVFEILYFHTNIKVPEFGAQAVLTGMMLLTGNWVSGVLQLAALAYNIQQYQLNRHLIDVTEVFREIKPRKKALTAKLIFNLLLFIWTVYRFIEILVLSLVTPSGKAAARSIIREAAASLHRLRRLL